MYINIPLMLGLRGDVHDAVSSYRVLITKTLLSLGRTSINQNIRELQPHLIYSCLCTLWFHYETPRTKDERHL